MEFVNYSVGMYKTLYKIDRTNHAENDVWNERTNFTTPPKRRRRERNFSVEK
tara:strand:- start:41 stop:196 length:156 start_codon:yes stop_codon:yes gene_type:complete